MLYIMWTVQLSLARTLVVWCLVVILNGTFQHYDHCIVVEEKERVGCFAFCYLVIYSRLSLFRSQRDSLKHFEISVIRHIRFAELRKIPIEQPNFTNEHVI